MDDFNITQGKNKMASKKSKTDYQCPTTSIPLGAEVIKKICVHEWNEKKQSYNEIKLLSILVNCQNVIPRKNERIWLADDKFNVQYEVDDISYYYSEKEFMIDIYVKEV